ncbi:hypothetical protein OE88DRAFT_1712266 [Heliocybe sulcata]|uniref:Ataxin-10 homolog n=1 Tax=Heliocybe sulcata TaxID=5364 RepID=A0A5C3N5J0_9AGAM|nr:hypothetical protein OE88DRAFT_1712266 [Heliocybe sulcata]
MDPSQEALVDRDGRAQVCLNLAKFTRNLVADVPGNQRRAWEIEPDLRRLLHHYTSYYALQEDSSASLARILGQTLCNLVTSNEELSSRLWHSYLEIPEEENVLMRVRCVLAFTGIRLLGCSRQDVALPGTILVLNCLNKHRDRVSELTDRPLGLRICVSLLDQISETFQEEGDNPIFDVGYSIFRTVAESGGTPRLYEKLLVKDEIITPHQTTLLKLLDAYLQSSAGEREAGLHTELTPFLLAAFAALSRYAQNAIREALGLSVGQAYPEVSQVSPQNPTGSPTSSANGKFTGSELVQQPPLKELDLVLPKASEALVLVCQCLITITLAASGGTAYTTQQRATVMEPAQTPEFISNLIETLRLLDLFLPRINFGKPVGGGPASHSTESPGFDYVKRDLVRLLGILCHETRSVQDCVRVSGGIPVVMNMCVVDERNPFLREHAVFCLRNLLHDNPENQAVVNEIQPI